MWLAIALLLSGPLQHTRELRTEQECVRVNGRTMCWEIISHNWDPRMSSSEWSSGYWKEAPPKYGYYPAEKHGDE